MRVLLSLALGFALTSYVSGDVVVYDNGAGGAAGIDNGFESDSDIPQWQADDVTLGSTITVTGVDWTGAYGFDNSPPVADDFTIAFYADNAGAPTGGAPMGLFSVGNAVNRVDSGFDVEGYDVYEYSADINFTMNAGSTYWLAIYGNTVGEDDDFFWGVLQLAGNSFESFNHGQNWSANTNLNRQDFRLTVVPEPSYAALLCVCLIAGRTRRLSSDVRIPTT